MLSSEKDNYFLISAFICLENIYKYSTRNITLKKYFLLPEENNMYTRRWLLYFAFFGIVFQLKRNEMYMHKIFIIIHGT